MPKLTFASAIGHHDSPILALRARKTVVGLGTFEAVTWAGATVERVEHVIRVARSADHLITRLRVDAESTVLWTF